MLKEQEESTDLHCIHLEEDWLQAQTHIVRNHVKDEQLRDCRFAWRRGLCGIKDDCISPNQLPSYLLFLLAS